MTNQEETTTQKTWFIVLTLFLFFPIGLFFMWKHKKFNMAVRVIISAFFGIAILANFGTEELEAEEEPVKEEKPVEKEESPKKEDKKEEPKKEEPKKEEKKEPKKEKTPKEELKEAMEGITLGELKSFDGNFDEEPFNIEVEFIGKENLTSNMTVSSLKIAILDAVYIVKESKYDVDNISINSQLPLTDKYGNTENDYVIRSEFTKETIDKLSDEQMSINTDNLDSIADVWWEHPAIRD